MKLINNIPHFTTSDFSEAGASISAIKVGLNRQRRGLVSCWEHIKEGRTVFINYDKLSDRYKALVMAHYGDPYKLLKAEATHNQLKQEFAVIETLQELHASKYLNLADYQFYLLEFGIKKTKADQLMRAAGWLRLLSQYKSAAQTNKIGFKSKTLLRNAVTDILVEEQLYGLRVSNANYLRSKETAWNKAALLSDQELNLTIKDQEQLVQKRTLSILISGKYNNSNRQVIGKTETQVMTIAEGKIDITEFHASNLLNLYMNYGSGNKLDFEQIHYEYTQTCEEYFEKPLSKRAVMNFLTRPDVQSFATLERDGYASYEKNLPHVHRKQVQYSLSKGSMDGFQVDFYTNTKTAEGKKARVMLTVVAVFDMASEAITGYDITMVEDGFSVRNALRNHLNRHEGQSDREIESDGGSAFKAAESRELINQISQFRSISSPHDARGKHNSNPKGRKAERLLQETNRLTQRIKGWKGTNITSIDQSRKSNPDYIQCQTTFEEGVKQVIELINAYNNIKQDKFAGKSRIQQFNTTMNPDARVFTPEMRAKIFDSSSKVKVHADYINLTVNRKKYTFHYPKAEQNRHRFSKKGRVKVYFDETDMSNLFVFGMNADETDEFFLTVIEPMAMMQGAKAEQSQEDLKILSEREQARKDKQANDRRKVVEAIAAAKHIELPVNATIDEKEALIEGYMLENGLTMSFEERYKEELVTVEAKADTAYYEDRILRGRGHQVPEPKISTDSKREFLKNKHKKR